MLNGNGEWTDVPLIANSFVVNIGDATAAAMVVRGLTAHGLVFRSFPITAGHTVLVQAAAGGTGHILCQWAKLLGATVIGTVSSAEKAELAGAHA